MRSRRNNKLISFKSPVSNVDAYDATTHARLPDSVINGEVLSPPRFGMTAVASSDFIFFSGGMYAWLCGKMDLETEPETETERERERAQTEIKTERCK